MKQSIEAYDEAAAAYHEHWKDRRPLDAVRRFGELAGRGALVLDVGSGPALDVRPLRDAGLTVVSGDRSFESMRIGHRLHPKRPLGCWDFRRLPFADRTFDGIWANAALQHLPRRELRAALRELRRVQRGGPIFLAFRLGQGDLEPVEDPPAGEVHITSLEPHEITALLLDQGYLQVETQERLDPFERHLTWLYGWGRLPSAL
jgi:SAM-dependent methyltransferase